MAEKDANYYYNRAMQARANGNERLAQMMENYAIQLDRDYGSGEAGRDGYGVTKVPYAVPPARQKNEKLYQQYVASQQPMAQRPVTVVRGVANNNNAPSVKENPKQNGDTIKSWDPNTTRDVGVTAGGYGGSFDDNYNDMYPDNGYDQEAVEALSFGNMGRPIWAESAPDNDLRGSGYGGSFAPVSNYNDMYPGNGYSQEDIEALSFDNMGLPIWGKGHY